MNMGGLFTVTDATMPVDEVNDLIGKKGEAQELVGVASGMAYTVNLYAIHNEYGVGHELVAVYYGYGPGHQTKRNIRRYDYGTDDPARYAMTYLAAMTELTNDAVASLVSEI